MASIMTNASALTALQSLNSTNKNLETTQARISTGYRVSEASDNAAYWSIATTMRSDNKALGTVQDGVSWEKQQDFLHTHHINSKTDCATCWARPICAGGCYHEAHTRYGSTERPNLHYCEWIRGWTDTCLRIYGEIAQANPSFLRQFEGATHEAPQPS